MKNLIAVAVAGLLTACVAPQPIALTTHFSPAEVAWAKAKGTNSVSGQGFLRQQGGGVVTCAGYGVSLVPVSAYSTERISTIYGSSTQGFADSILAPKLTSSDPGYDASKHMAQCDAQGNFTLTGLADGDYYLVTQVIWMAGNAEQGGSLMQKVSLHGGEHKQVLLTNKG